MFRRTSSIHGKMFSFLFIQQDSPKHNKNTAIHSAFQKNMCKFAAHSTTATLQTVKKRYDEDDTYFYI